MKISFVPILKHWLPLAVVCTGLSGTGYVMMQQNLRLGANDAPAQLAEDIVTQVNANLPVRLPQPVDISQSLSPFVMLYTKAGQVASSSGTLVGKVPLVPAGVLASAARQGQDRVTWQPRSGVRIAAVVMPTANGYVLAGRNLREVEVHEDQQLRLMLLGWLGTLGGSLVVIGLLELLWPKSAMRKK